MSEQTGDHLVPVHTPANLCHGRMAGIDLNRRIVRTCSVPVLGRPIDIHVDTPIIPIAFGLRCSHIFEMPCKDPGSKELPVRDFAAFLVQKLFDSFVIHLCHIRSLLLEKIRKPYGVWG